jgi:plasmid maintenance system antidote protein VapI
MHWDTKKMHTDILRRLNSIKKPQRYLTEKLGVHRSTLYRISQGNDITTKTFLTLIKWLDYPAERYLYDCRKNQIK